MADRFLRTFADIQEEAEARLEREHDPDMALVSDYVIGVLDDDRERAVRHRIATDPDFRALAEPLLAVYSSRQPVRSDRKEIERGWADLQRRIGIARGAPTETEPAVARFRAEVRKSRGRTLRIMAWSMAAMLMLAVIPAAAATFFKWREGAGRTGWRETATRPLADGSVAALGSRTRLVEIGDLASEPERWVVLDGEATFTVRSIVGRPFVVRTATSDIWVTGTVFTVRSYGQDFTTLSVKEGSVNVRVRSVSGDGESARRDVVAGQTVRIHKGFPPEPAP